MTIDRATEPSSTSAVGTAAGLAGVACVACCAGPIVGFVTALGVGATIAGMALFGVAGLALALVVVPFVRRRRSVRASCTPATADPVPVSIQPNRRP